MNGNRGGYPVAESDIRAFERDGAVCLRGRMRVDLDPDGLYAVVTDIRTEPRWSSETSWRLCSVWPSGGTTPAAPTSGEASKPCVAAR